MNLSKRELRQIDNLSRTCKFDMEKRSALVQLHYSTPEELLDMHLGSVQNPVVSDDAIEYLCDIISDIPKKFSVEFALTIDDYGEYNSESLLNALRATIENTFYFHDEGRKKNNIIAVIFLIIGILILAVDIIGSILGWFGFTGSIEKDIITYILEILVWVFIWESAAMIFLTYENESTIFSGNVQRFYGLSFLNSEGIILSSLTQEQFYDGWIYLGGKEAFARNYILFSNAILFAVVSIQAFEFFAFKNQISTIELILSVVFLVAIILLAISNIAFYRDSWRIKRFALALSVITLCLSIVEIVYYCINGNLTARYFIGDIVLAIDLVINVICIHYMQKLNIEVK